MFESLRSDERLARPAQWIILNYLLQNELLSSRVLVADALRISDASFRNTNFRVESELGPSYLLKQGVGAERSATVGHEAAVYEALLGSGAGTGVARFLPRFFGFEEADSTLILDLVREAETLGERHTRTGKFSVGLAREVGRALAALHSITLEDNPESVQGA